MALDAGIAGVITAIMGAVAIGPATSRIADRTGETVADRTRIASAGLATPCRLSGLAALLARLSRLAVLPWLLTRLTALTRLPAAGERAGLGLLTTGLTRSILYARLSPRTSAQTRKLVAQTG
jgi:hypothetical protein